MFQPLKTKGWNLFQVAFFRFQPLVFNGSNRQVPLWSRQGEAVDAASEAWSEAAASEMDSSIHLNRLNQWKLLGC